MNSHALIELWEREENEPFCGWDFTSVKDRIIEDPIPWSYFERVQLLLSQASSVLDIGTGGGEFLLKCKEYWPNDVTASEGYPPNVPLARQRLEPLAVSVVEMDSSNDVLMPFEDNRFDLVLSRHAAFNASEIGRILAPGGIFLTQQVHGLWCYDLLAAFDSKPPWPDSNLEMHVAKLQGADLKIIQAEDWSGRIRFKDVGAIVFQLKASPWLVPSFSVKTHLNALLALRSKLEDEGILIFTAKYFLIEAAKCRV